MLDQIYSAIRRWHDHKHPQKETERLFTSRRFISPGSKKVYIILDPWHINPALFYFVERKIKKSRASYIHYSFAPDILTADPELTRQRFETFSRQIRDELEEFSKLNAINHITIIGVSLSCVTASLIASDNPLVTELIMVVPGYSLADSMWNGLRTRNVRVAMEARGIRLVELQKQWKKLAPEYYLTQLKDKKLKIIISRTDRIIPASFGKRYAEAARKIIPTVVVIENRWFGHYASILNYSYLSKDIWA
ncbi:MAG: hypothetical protein V1668_02555 [Patescibacteria group bacterium]